MISPLDSSLTLVVDALAAELQAIQAESIGWLPLGQGGYLHHGDPQASHDDMVIQVNKKDTHFNCLNKQHSLNSCPWPDIKDTHVS
ncbi:MULTISPECIES: hypothetical protein [unclassified Acidovorax]|uniref:hypothetical protein n=1 Tax=unclassified Acidovorax TaxID=2684926 RepID=UPI0025C6150B|nr:MULTISPECIES: hypothetical protein [unclassified Acidovorax]HQS20110.1 hypothetical protein [Acidovorax defluvii]HQT17287.1 hypothetical protein [Acidovorax defluvii]HQT49250.1 hypothetical protein [Acidovorax defluvii]